MRNITVNDLSQSEKKWYENYIKRTAKGKGISQDDPILTQLKQQLLNKISKDRAKAENEAEKVKRKDFNESIQIASSDGKITPEEQSIAINEATRKANIKKNSYRK